MSNFQLPPLLGFDPKARASYGALLRPESRVQGPLGPGLGALTGAAGEAAPAEAPQSEFGTALTQALGGASAMQDDVQQKTRGLVLGEGVELHDVMLATDKSEVTFNLLLEVRNKLVDAWEKLSRSAV